MTFLIGGANSAADTGYNIDNSLRFAKGDTAYLSNATGGTSTLNTKITLSFWIKLGNNTYDDTVAICWGYVDSSNRFGITMYQNKIIIYLNSAGDALEKRSDSIRYRDPSAWYHIVVAVDTTQGTATNRIKLYVNGVAAEINAGDSPGEDDTIAFTQNVTQSIGANWSGSAWEGHLDGYLSEFYCIDGLAYDADDFGETDEDSGIWKPKDAKDDLTFGNNGFYLEFKNSAVGTGASDTIGADTSGKDQHFTSVNVAVVDNCTDSPTNNFCTLLGNENLPRCTMSEGNLQLTHAGTSGYWDSVRGTLGANKGKWYYEYKVVQIMNATVGNIRMYPAWVPIELCTNEGFDGRGGESTMIGAQGSAKGYAWAISQGYMLQDGTDGVTYGAAVSANGDICMMALDLDGKEHRCGVNGQWADGAGSNDQTFGNAAHLDIRDDYNTYTNNNGFFLPAIPYRWDTGVVDIGACNFGNPPFAISSGNADANGYGNFEFAVPSGYYALCTKNLAEFG